MKLILAIALSSILCGQKLAFIQDHELWVKQLPDGTPRVLVQAGMQHAPQFSADGQWIAFLDGEQLCLTAASGGEIYRPLGAQSAGFRWSDSGATLAISTEDSVYVASAASGWIPSRILAGEPDGVVFSPDGTRLAIATVGETPEGTPKRGAVEIVQVDGSAPAKTIYVGGEWEQLSPLAWTGDTVVAWKGEFSASAASDGFEIYAIPVIGGAVRKLGGPALLYDDLHQISPDQTRLALTNGEGRLAWTRKQIAVVDLTTGKMTALTGPETAALFAAWSPKGDMIAFSAGPDAGDVWGGPEAKVALNGRRIWIMNADGSEPRQITTDAGYRDERPIWSADGKSLFFFRIGHDDQSSLWSVNLAGGEPKRLAGPFPMDTEDGWFGNYGYVDWNELAAISMR